MLDQLRPPPNRFRHFFAGLAVVAIIAFSASAFMDEGRLLSSGGHQALIIGLFVAMLAISITGYTTAHWYWPGRGYIGFVIDEDGEARPARRGPYLTLWTQLPSSLGGRPLLLFETGRSYYFNVHPFELLVESPEQPPTAEYVTKLYALLRDVERAKAGRISIPVTVAQHRGGLPNVRLLELAVGGE